MFTAALVVIISLMYALVAAADRDFAIQAVWLYTAGIVIVTLIHYNRSNHHRD